MRGRGEKIFYRNLICWQETLQGCCEIFKNYEPHLIKGSHTRRGSEFLLRFHSSVGTSRALSISVPYCQGYFFLHSPRSHGWPLWAGWQGCWGCCCHWQGACVHSSWLGRWPAAGQGCVDVARRDPIRQRKLIWNPASGTASPADSGFDEDGTWSFPGGFVPVERKIKNK